MGHYNHRPYCIADLYALQPLATGAVVANEETLDMTGSGCFRTRNSQLLARYYLERNSQLLVVRVLEEEAEFQCSWVGTRTADGNCHVKHVCIGVERYCRCREHQQIEDDIPDRSAAHFENSIRKARMAAKSQAPK